MVYRYTKYHGNLRHLLTNNDTTKQDLEYSYMEENEMRKQQGEVQLDWRCAYHMTASWSTLTVSSLIMFERMITQVLSKSVYNYGNYDVSVWYPILSNDTTSM